MQTTAFEDHSFNQPASFGFTIGNISDYNNLQMALYTVLFLKAKMSF